jgi:hypothetical protein
MIEGWSKYSGKKDIPGTEYQIQLKYSKNIAKLAVISVRSPKNELKSEGIL